MRNIYEPNLSNAERAIKELSGATMCEMIQQRKKEKTYTYFEMREKLLGPGLRFAYRLSDDDMDWVTRYDVEKQKFIKTDFTCGSDWDPTIEEIEATDWVVCEFKYKK